MGKHDKLIIKKEGLNKPSDISAKVLSLGAEAKKHWLESGSQRDKGQEKAVLCLAGASDVSFHVAGVGAFSILNWKGFTDAKTSDKKYIIDTILKLFFSATDAELENKVTRDRLKTPFLQIWETVAYVMTSGGEFKKDGDSLMLFPAALIYPNKKEHAEQRRVKANSEASVGGKTSDISFEKLKGVAAFHYRGSTDKKGSLEKSIKQVLAALEAGVEASVNSRQKDFAYMLALLETFRFPPEVLKKARQDVIKLENKLDLEASEGLEVTPLKKAA